MALIHLAPIGSLLIIIGLIYGADLGALMAMIGLICLVGSNYSRHDGWRLFGPFALWDLIRTARNVRLFIIRFLLAMVVLAYLIFSLSKLGGNYSDVANQNAMSMHVEAMFIFISLAIIIFCLIFCLLTFPSIMAEERETNRLEHLLVTDLTNQEIILGKMAGRVAVLVGYTITLLPILVLLTFLGGIDPNQVLLGSIMLVLSLAGLTGICIGCSANAKSNLIAIRNTIIILIALMFFVYFPRYVLEGLPTISLSTSWVTRTLEFFAHLDPMLVLERVESNTSSNYFDANTLHSLRLFAANQWLILVLGWTYGSEVLRRQAKRGKAPSESMKQSQESTAHVYKGSYRPPLRACPVLWNQLHTSRTAIGRISSRMGNARFVLAPLLTLMIIGCFSLINVFHSMFVDLLYVSGIISFLTLAVPAGLMASQYIAWERQHDTLDSLLMTSLETEHIIREKWWAAVLNVRVGYLIWLTIWTTGLALGHMRPFVYVLINLVAIANIMLAASLGLLSSIYSRTPIAAMGKLAGYSLLYTILMPVTCACLTAGSPGISVIYFAVNPIAPQLIAPLLNDTTNRLIGTTYLLPCTIVGIIMSSFMAVSIRAMVNTLFREQVRPPQLPRISDEK